MTKAAKTAAKRGRKAGKSGQKPPAQPRGRPPKYKPEYVQVARVMAEMGATDAEFADAFGVDLRTITRWKYDYPEFKDATNVSKEVADARMEQSLYQRGVGYTFDSEEIKVIEGEVVRVVTRKHIPPDPTSAIFWMVNRSEGRWQNLRSIKHEAAKGSSLDNFFNEISGRSIRPKEA